MVIDDILNKMDDLIDAAVQIPLSGGKCVVNTQKLLDFMDDLRLNMPTELKQAKAIVSDRNEIIADAKRTAEDIIAKAEAKANAIVSESEIVRRSELKATEVLSAANQKAKELKSASTDFAENIFKVSEDMLVASLNEVKKARQSVRGNKLD